MIWYVLGFTVTAVLAVFAVTLICIRVSLERLICACRGIEKPDAVSIKRHPKHHCETNQDRARKWLAQRREVNKK